MVSEDRKNNPSICVAEVPEQRVEDRKNNPSICVAGRVSRWQFASPVPPVAVSPPVAQATVTVLALTAPGIIVKARVRSSAPSDALGASMQRAGSVWRPLFPLSTIAIVPVGDPVRPHRRTCRQHLLGDHGWFGVMEWREMQEMFDVRRWRKTALFDRFLSFDVRLAERSPFGH